MSEKPLSPEQHARRERIRVDLKAAFANHEPALAQFEALLDSGRYDGELGPSRLIDHAMLFPHGVGHAIALRANVGTYDDDWSPPVPPEPEAPAVDEPAVESAGGDSDDSAFAEYGRIAHEIAGRIVRGDLTDPEIETYQSFLVDLASCMTVEEREHAEAIARSLFDHAHAQVAAAQESDVAIEVDTDTGSADVSDDVIAPYDGVLPAVAEPPGFDVSDVSVDADVIGE